MQREQDQPVAEPVRRVRLFGKTRLQSHKGIDSSGLVEALRFVREKALHLHTLLVARHGRVVLDAAISPYPSNARHAIASATKSFTSTLIGIAQDRGYISDLDRPVLEFFPERTTATPDPRKQRMTLRHLLTMSSGLKCDSEVTAWNGRRIVSNDWTRDATRSHIGLHEDALVLVGLDGTARLGVGRQGLPVLAKGQWTSADTFLLELEEPGHVFTWELELRFVGERIEVHLREANSATPEGSFGCVRSSESL